MRFSSAFVRKSIKKFVRILVFNNFLLKYYQLYIKTARDKNHLFSSHRTLRIFLEFFINFFLSYENTILKNSKKNSEKILRTLKEENKQFLSLPFSIKLIIFE